jgi:putative redox protein
MPPNDFDFANRTGRKLTGRLETGASPPRVWAVFAHCFTCDKSSLAAVRVSRALAKRGIGVLRFDFTGLGESQGQFGSGLSGDVADVVSAANAMNAAGMKVQLLIGHSFGGAAVIAAARAIETVTAVAVIGAPFDAEHVLAHVGSTLDGLAPGERVRVSIGGRDFELGTEFVADIRSHNQQERIANLRSALLVIHSPIDEVVSVDNAALIFQSAHHPKSFVSLDTANHMLSVESDAEYCAAVIAAWADRYLGAD